MTGMSRSRRTAAVLLAAMLALGVYFLSQIPVVLK